jgi:hypothetical protein
MQKASTRTLYDYWNSLRGARSAPDRRDIDPTRIRAALSNTFILEANPEGQFNFRLAGSHLCTAYARELKGRSFSQLWHNRDRDAVDTLIKAVTEDNAVALVTFQAANVGNAAIPFEAILLPLRHNGSTTVRILGAMTALDEPYWLGIQPIVEQRISGLRLIWPDETGLAATPRDLTAQFVDAATVIAAVHPGGRGLPPSASRRYAHLSVIDGGRD